MNKPKVEKVNNSREVSIDTVYSELYAEMRRFRDYELTASTWYTVILLAILAALLTVKFGSSLPTLSGILSSSLIIRIVIAVLVTIIGFCGSYSVKYAFWRYDELRKYVNGNLEPKWKVFKPKERKIVPRKLILLTQAVLVIATDILILWPT